MSTYRHRTFFMVVGLAALLGAAGMVLGAGAAAAAGPPVRSGEVISTAEHGIWTLIHARDAKGKEFWVWSGTCVVPAGGRVQVLEGQHYDKIESQGRVMEDCYVARRVLVDGKEVKATGAHGLPDGCIVL